MPQLGVAGAVLNYESWGDSGAWVTLVNGHCRPLNDFRMLGRKLTECGYRVLALDNRGSGLTQTSAAFSFPDMSADVAALWEHLEIGTTALLGISMGGLIAQALAGGEATQSRVNRLFLVSTTLRQALIHRDRRPWSAEAAEVEDKLRPYFSAAFLERNLPLLQGMAKQIAKAVKQGHFAEQSQQQISAVRGLDLTETASRIRAPTHILHGAADEIIPLTAGVELQAHIKGASLEVFPNAGHLLLAEAPQALYAALIKALT